jgi:predicted O-linked N-acetylglucosamine transferase (SPINDLY family)
MGIAFQDLGGFDQAISCYKRALQIKPDYFESYHNMGNAYKDQGQLNEAVSCYQQVLQLRPDHAEAYNNMGVVFKDQGKLDKAMACYQKALQLKADFVEAHYNMGIAFQIGGRYDEGLRHYVKALKLGPDYSPARWLYLLSLPILYKTKEDMAYYRNRFTGNLDTLIKQTRLDTPKQREAALKGIGTSTNFYLQYQGLNDLDLQKKYGRFVCSIMASNYPQWTRTRTMPLVVPKEKIRVGYVSSFMQAHTVGEFLMGWVENSNRNDFEIYCYYIGQQSDQYTEQFQHISDHFYQICGNLEAVAHQIHSDNLHILVFTDIGMYAPATQLAGLRLASIQCKGWGHPVTTGLPTVDYYLSSDLMEPKNAQDHYSEKLIQLPNIALVYKRPNLPQCPKTRKAFGIKEEAFVYLTPQSLFKYLPQYDTIYPCIAQRVPNAQFVFLSNSSPQITHFFKDRLNSSFQRYNLVFEKYCLFQPRQNFEDFLSLNIASDVLLDTLSWSGGKTTLEGISCGLPVVTCPGDLMRGRHAFAMLKMIGVTETIAEDENDYIEIASKLGRDKDFYLRIKMLIKENREKLYNDTRCIQTLEEFYRSVVI